MILVTGAGGQVGSAVLCELRKRGVPAIGTTRESMELSFGENIAPVLFRLQPEAVIHCGAYTSPDRAEEESELCYQVNQYATKKIALCCKQIGAKLLYLSTDYVFSGQKKSPYEVWDTPLPLNVYGKSKFLGEEAVRDIVSKYFIVRTAWVFSGSHPNFVNAMLNLGKEKEEVFVVEDQIGCPTYAKDLAGFLCDLVETDRYGVYHAAGSGSCSRKELAEEVFRIKGIPCKVRGILSSQYPSKASRPLYSVLSVSSMEERGFAPFPPWREGLIKCLA